MLPSIVMHTGECLDHVVGRIVESDTLGSTGREGKGQFVSDIGINMCSHVFLRADISICCIVERLVGEGPWQVYTFWKEMRS